MLLEYKDTLKNLMQNGRLSPESYRYMISESESEGGSYDVENSTASADISGQLRISIIIPTYNRNDSLVKTLNGIFLQRYDNYEIVIIDDHSIDPVKVEAERLCTAHKRTLRYAYNEISLGAGDSRKRGYRLATGDIVIFSDDDDYYIDPLYFQKLNAIFKKYPDTVMVCANALIEDLVRHTLSAPEIDLPDGISCKRYLNGFFFRYTKPNSSFVMALNQKMISQIPYDDLRFFNDTSLYLYALLAKGRVRVIREAVGVYCVHGSNMSVKVKPEFIVENLDSKLDIYRKARERSLLLHPEEWLYIQLLITINYYFDGISAGMKGDFLIYHWVQNNLNGMYRFKMSVRMWPKILRNVGRNLAKGRKKGKIRSLAACHKKTKYT